jgi:hypothetical protein
MDNAIQNSKLFYLTKIPKQDLNISLGCLLDNFSNLFKFRSKNGYSNVNIDVSDDKDLKAIELSKLFLITL